MVDKWHKVPDEGEPVVVIFVDFHKASDLTAHDVLLQKLKF